MQPEQDNNVGVPTIQPIEPVTPSNPIATPAPIMTTNNQSANSQPVAQPIQPTQPVQTAPMVTGSSSSGGFISQLKSIFSNPKEYFDSTALDLKKSIIFVAINLGIMSVATMITSLITTLSSSGFSGDYFWELLKGISLCALYVSAFLFAISGIIMVASLIAKKDAKFSSVFSIISVFSLNFIAVSLASTINLLSNWINSADFLSILSLITNIIVSLVFIYTCSLIIHGIASTTKFNLFKSTLIYIVSTIVLVFLFSKMIDTFPIYFSISFGQYSGFSGTGASLRSYLNLLNSYF